MRTCCATHNQHRCLFLSFISLCCPPLRLICWRVLSFDVLLYLHSCKEHAYCNVILTLVMFKYICWWVCACICPVFHLLPFSLLLSGKSFGVCAVKSRDQAFTRGAQTNMIELETGGQENWTKRRAVISLFMLCSNLNLKFTAFMNNIAYPILYML